MGGQAYPQPAENDGAGTVHGAAGADPAVAGVAATEEPTVTPLPTASPTATFLPTDTPTALPTTPPTPAADPRPRARVVVKSANLRQGPGTAYAKAGAVSRDAVLVLTGSDAVPARWWRVSLPNGGQAWISGELVEATNTAGILPVAYAPLPPTPTPPPPPASAPLPNAPSATPKPQSRWVLVANSLADYPGPLNERRWFYLWSDGRNNFEWKDMYQPSQDDCYFSHDARQLMICRDRITTGSRGDVTVQWKATSGGTYRFEWDSASLAFYKHLDFIGSQRKGTELTYSTELSGIIDWEALLLGGDE